MNLRDGAAIAAIVAGMLTGCASDTKDTQVGKAEEGLKCQGANECKAMSECASAEGKNSCQGMNECKGMGWITVDTESDCDALGGSVIES